MTVEAPALELRHFRAGYSRGNSVVDDVSLELQPGELLAVVGPNGAGKSTLLKGIMRLTPFVGGETSVEGVTASAKSAHEMARMRVSMVHEGRGILNSMSVEDNLRAGAQLAPAATREPGVQETFERFPILAQRRLKAAGLLSGGEQQMLAISRAILSRPRVLLMDEPSLGLAPQTLCLIADYIRDLRDAGLALLLVDQNVEFCRQAGAQNVWVLRHGRVVHRGGLTTEAGRSQIQSAYLGTGESTRTGQASK